ncbi:MAG: lysophospholipid acyltransferase family protein [Akkermansiaceae bacterium]|nr:lysophospholipid acyltransferase family protein [Armatimonadota bacterium]
MNIFKSARGFFRRIFSHEQRVALLSRLLSSAVMLLHRTWRVTLENEDAVAAVLKEHGAVILVTWHGRLLVPFACTQNRGYYALVSRSGDGALLSAIFERLGWRLIRGSSNKFAVEALRQGREILSQPGTVLAFTPDGPRGPARIAKPGMIYYAQKTGKPIIPVGVSARPRRFLRSWDRFLIPLPFAKCLWIYGDPIYAGPKDDLAELTERVQTAINRLEEEAERRLGNKESMIKIPKEAAA